MVIKTKYPGICNNCGQKSEYYIRCGTHALQLCGTYLARLSYEVPRILKEEKTK